MSQATGTTADTLLAHADWMRALAIRLVRDPDRADDVVQESFAAALERPPRHTENLRGWLGRVVTNRARQMGRSDARRTRREHERANAEALPSAEALVLEAELQRTIVAAVLALDEPYRRTVLLRYYRGYSPKEIAAQLDVPAATVRSRLMRGLAMLRTDLDRRHDGDRRKWSALVVPLARGGAFALLSIKVKLAAAAAVVGVAAWIGLDGTTPPAAPPLDLAPVANTDDDAELAVVDPVEVERDEARTEVAIVTEESEPEAPALPPLTGSYVGQVTDPNSDPISGATVGIYPKVGTDWDELEPIVTGTTDSTGRFEIPVPSVIDAESRIFMKITADAHRPAYLNPIFPDHPMEFTLGWTTEMFGTVVDDDTGEPLADVRISADRREVMTGPDGGYRFTDLPVGESMNLSLAKDDYAAIEVEFTAPTRAPVERTLRLPRGIPMRLSVVDHDTGEPLEGAELKRAYRETLAVSDSEGVIELRLVPGADMEFELLMDDHAELTWHVTIDDTDAFESVTARMLRYGVIEGSLANDVGEPIAGAYLYASNGDARSYGRLRERDGLPGRVFDRVSRDGNRPSNEQGRFEIRVLPSESPYSIRGGSPELVSVSHGGVEVTEGGQRVSVDLVQVGGGSIRGRVLYNGSPLAYGSVICKRGSKYAGASRIDEEGNYLIENVLAGDVELRVRDDSREAPSVPEPVSLTVDVGKEVLHDFVWESEVAPICGFVFDANGAPAPEVWVQASRHDASGFTRARARTDAAGAFELDTIPGEPYRLHAFARPAVEASVDAAPGTDGVEITLPLAGAVHVRLLDAATGEVVLPARMTSRVISSRPSGADSFRHVRRPEALNGVIRFVVPITTEPATLDLEVALHDLGYPPTRAFDVPITREDDPPRIVEIELERGLTCKLKLVSDEPLTLERRRGHLIFAMHEDQAEALRGPFPSQGGPSNHRINGVNMWIDTPSVIDQMPDFEEGSGATLTGLRPGRYTLKVFPAGISFTPDSFVLTEDGQSFELKWR